MRAERAPTFLVIGAAKAGTTSIHDSLGQHPEVFVPDIKEPHFFALEGQRRTFTGPGDEYLNKYGVHTLADYEALFEKGAGKKARGEASPWYLYMDGVAENIYRQVPSAKLVAILRNPVDRAYSSYLHVVRDGREPLTFEEGLAAEQERISAGWEPIWHYVAAGKYTDSIRQFRARFNPDQLKVFLYEDLQKDPAGTIASVFDFVGVDPSFLPDTSSKLNATGVPSGALGNLIFRNNPIKSFVRLLLPAGLRQKMKANSSKLLTKPEMDPHTRAKLKMEFAPDVRELQDLLGRDLSAWL